MVALEEKADNTFQYLVDNGADLKAQDEEGNSILHRALMGKKSKQAKYLIK
jgi:ankyrin repeat protein